MPLVGASPDTLRRIERDNHLRMHMEKRGFTSDDLLDLVREAVDTYPVDPSRELWGPLTARKIVRTFGVRRFVL